MFAPLWKKLSTKCKIEAAVSYNGINRLMLKVFSVNERQGVSRHTFLKNNGFGM
jgi:hypothetical protein